MSVIFPPNTITRSVLDLTISWFRNSVVVLFLFPIQREIRRSGLDASCPPARLTDGRFAALLRPLLLLPLLFIIATVIAERNSGWMDARIVGRAEGG